jgi:cytochrome c-type biogenesis protein CcmF
MLAELGQILLILAFLLAVLQGWLGLHGAHVGDRRAMAFAERATVAQSVLCVVAFGLLATLFVTSDFSVSLVALNSHTSKPMIYKFSGTWANHEGSMLMWVMIMALFGGAMVWFGQTLPRTLRARAVAVQGLVGAGFLAFLIFTSNPFARLSPAPLDGSGLNPLLQDPGLALHPPFLYLGYVGFSVAFSLAVAALIEGRVDAMWARWVRPWVLLAWSFLTIGIALGSLWAYYELGWGGWWFWDPVENVSFMPWLAGTALLHSTLVAQSRGSFMRWTLLLAITTFSLSLVGTFIVRSGVLTSVHAFAVDPERGVFILALLLLATGGALTLYALRSHKIEHGASFQGVSREAGLVINNIAIIIATVIVFLGTFYPLFIDALTGDKITVGPPYYNLMFVILTLPLMVFMGVGPMLKWRTDTLSRLKPVMAKMAIFALVIAVLTAIWGRNVYGVLGMAAAAWLAAGTAAVYAKRLRVGEAKSDAGNLWRRFRLLPGAAHGFAMAHMGMAVMLAGITGMSVWMAEDIDRLKLGESINLAGYEYRLESMAGKQGDNYIADAGVVTVWKNGQQLSTLRPERRYYPVEENFTTEGAMGVGFSRIVYAAIGEGGQEQGWIVRVYYHPMVVFIWLGALIMSIGGFVSLADRRYGFVRGPKRVRASATKPKLSEAAV